jgi:transposase
MFDPAKIQHVYIACGYTDLRRGIDGLAGIIQNTYHLDPFANALFLFCGHRVDRFKALYWDSDGFILLYKRLERGRYQWPRSRNEVMNLTPQQYRWFLEGLSINQPQAHQAVTDIVHI